MIAAGTPGEPTEFALRSSQFRRERESTWRELEALLARAHRGSVSRLTPEDIAALPVLYRAAVSSLSVARAISLDRNLLEYLEGLVARAYVLVYASQRRPLDVLLDFITARFPRLVRRFGVELALAIGLLVAGVAAGYVLTSTDPGRYANFVPADRAEGRTFASSADELRKVLYDTGADRRPLTAFASAIFVNNARVAILAAGLGPVAGLPTAFLLMREGLVLGAMAALHDERGLGLDFALWLAPHGITELFAICLCAAVGLALARALLFPGSEDRLSHVARVGREAALVVSGAVVMLFCAGMIEGLFRQLVTSPGIRAAVAVTSFVAWVLYFGFAGRGIDRRRDGGQPEQVTP